LLLLRFAAPTDAQSGRSTLTAKTSQTISRILGAKHDGETTREGVGPHDDYSDFDPSMVQHRPAFVHVAPSHTRARKELDTSRLSPLQSEIPGTAAAHQHTEPPPSKDFLHADPRFDDQRWDNVFLAPLLPVQVNAAYRVTLLS
jgi:hypothetical protein